MKLTFETLKKLIKEELNLLENQYGEEFNPQMEVPDDHEGERSTNGRLLYRDEKNKPFYHSYINQLIKHEWLLDRFIEAVQQVIRTEVRRFMNHTGYGNLSEDEKWIEIYKDTVEIGEREDDIRYLIRTSFQFIKKMYKQEKEYFPIPDYLNILRLTKLLFEKNPNNLNDDILDEAKRMFYFMKDLYQGKLPYKPEVIDAIKSNKETFNQAFSGYDGPAPEDSYEGKDIFDFK